MSVQVGVGRRCTMNVDARYVLLILKFETLPKMTFRIWCSLKLSLNSTVLFIFLVNYIFIVFVLTNTFFKMSLFIGQQDAAASTRMMYVSSSPPSQYSSYLISLDTYVTCRTHW